MRLLTPIIGLGIPPVYLPVYPETVAVLIKLDEGPDLVLHASLADVTEALSAALKSGDRIRVNVPDGTFELNPNRVVSVTTEPDQPEENGARAGQRRAVPA